MNDFDQSRFTVLDNGTLYISEVHREDENKYGCTAGNSAGLNRKEVQLIVHSKQSYSCCCGREIIPYLFQRVMEQ